MRDEITKQTSSCVHWIIAGVSGSGKTTIGRALASRVGAVFHDADAFHPPANVQKMRAGVPLTDDDRWPWLEQLNILLTESSARESSVVLACSALREVYRERLGAGTDPRAVRWVHLHGSKEVIAARIASREGHYMPPQLLESQFAALEPFRSDVWVVDVGDPCDKIVEGLVERARAIIIDGH
jgi:gluconokinase